MVADIFGMPSWPVPPAKVKNSRRIDTRGRAYCRSLLYFLLLCLFAFSTSECFRHSRAVAIKSNKIVARGPFHGDPAHNSYPITDQRINTEQGQEAGHPTT